MKRFVLPLCLLVGRAIAGPPITGKVLDPSGAGIAGARIDVASRVGPVLETASDARGAFYIELDDPAGLKLIVTAPGFARHEVPLDRAPEVIRLELAPTTDTITVTGSAIPAPLSEQGSSVTVIPRAEIEGRNEASALDLLRGVPGVAVNQTGQRGGATSLFVRGGESKYNLVLIDGVPVNDMRFGGFFDFAHLPTDQLDRVEVIRGAQSAVYGSYANASVINFVTRLDERAPLFHALAEGGTFATRRFATGAAGSWRGFRASTALSRLDTDGDVDNSDYRNENVSVNIGKRFRAQDLSFRGGFNSSENGVPGPYGSNPVGNFSGFDRVSRNQNNFSNYILRYDAALSGRARQELFGTFFLGNNSYRSRFGSSFNKDLRGTAEARTTVSISEQYTLAFGYAFAREQVKNTFITDNSARNFPLRRDQQGIYAENRFQFGRRLFVNAGVRTEVIQTPFIPANTGSRRPDFTAQTQVQVNPKLGAALRLTPSTRAHSSFGTGIRPPGGFELAFTNNPSLRPERTRSFDVGIEQRVGGRLSLDVTYFDNHYDDLIVSLGGSLSRLGSYTTDNLSNSRARGAEFSAELRPTAKLSLGGSYTLLDAKILALDGSTLAPQYYRVGQRLPRRPRNSGTLHAAWFHKRMSAFLSGSFRGEALDTEPSFGAFGGFYPNPGYANVALSLNFNVGRGVTLYGNLRNALNQRYEEIYGFPSPRLNFVAGLKWRSAE